MKSKSWLVALGLLLAVFAGCSLQKSIEAKGVFHEFQGIFTMVEPVSLELYRSLLADIK